MIFFGMERIHTEHVLYVNIYRNIGSALVAATGLRSRATMSYFYLLLIIPEGMFVL